MSIYKKKRLDQILVERGLVATRSRAADLVRLGAVIVQGVTAAKPGALFVPDVGLSVDESASPFVSRGGLKLAAALDAFGFDPTGLAALDVGASTGGFTDVLLTRGAAKIYAVDVGRDQLHLKLRTDPRVVVMEGTDARSLDGAAIARADRRHRGRSEFHKSYQSCCRQRCVLPRLTLGSLSWSSRNSRPGAKRWAKAASCATRRRGRGPWPRFAPSSMRLPAGRWSPKFPRRFWVATATRKF